MRLNHCLKLGVNLTQLAISGLALTVTWTEMLARLIKVGIQDWGHVEFVLEPGLHGTQGAPLRSAPQKLTLVRHELVSRNKWPEMFN